MPKKSHPLDLTIPGLSTESKQIVYSLARETDRGMALVGAAYLDDVLAAMLRASLVDRPKAVDGLLDYPGPLSSFAARCDLAFCIGLIGNKTYTDLKVIRKIRNGFAHGHAPASFEEPGIKSLCMQLKAVTDLPPSLSDSPRCRFMASAVALADKLMMEGCFLKHRDIGKDFEFADGAAARRNRESPKGRD